RARKRKRWRATKRRVGSRRTRLWPRRSIALVSLEMPPRCVQWERRLCWPSRIKWNALFSTPTRNSESAGGCELPLLAAAEQSPAQRAHHHAPPPEADHDSIDHRIVRIRRDVTLDESAHDQQQRAQQQHLAGLRRRLPERFAPRRVRGSNQRFAQHHAR